MDPLNSASDLAPPPASLDASVQETYLTDRLGWTSTVARELVHRRGAGDVLLTGVSRAGDDSFLLAVRWPVTPSFYGPDQLGRHDPMLILETLRQAATAVAHAGYGVAFGDQLVMGHMNFVLADPTALAVSGRPADLLARLGCSNLRYRGDSLKSAQVRLSLERDGRHMAEARGSLVCVPGPTYQKLLARRCPGAVEAPHDRWATVLPAVVGRTSAADVLLYQPAGWRPGHPVGSWPLRIDLSHPELFDHRVDHLPGMVQLEVFRQAALATTATTLDLNELLLGGCAIQFGRMVELDQPTWCRAEIVDLHTVSVQLHQHGPDPLSHGTMTLYP